MKLLKPFTFSVLLLWASIASVQAQTSECCNIEQPRYYTSTGTAEIKVKPDRVTLTLGVKDRVQDLKAGRDKMDGIIRAAIAHAQKRGVQAKHIQTARLDIRPEYRYDDNHVLLLTYYELNQSLTFTLENVDLYDKLIYELLDLGINVVSDIQFSSTEVRKYRDQARVQAVQAAKEKAELITKAAGLKLGEVYNVAEQESYYPVYRGAQMMNSSQNISQAGGGSSDEGSAAAGMISISATVNLTYKLAD